MLPKPKYAFFFIIGVVLITSLLINFFLLGGYSWLQNTFFPQGSNSTTYQVISETTNETDSLAPTELSIVLNPTSDPTTTVTVSKINGNYATGGVTSSSGGYRWWAYQTEKGWKVAWSGQNDPSCKALRDYNFPEEFYPNGCSENY